MHSTTTPKIPPTLAEAVERASWPKNRATVLLEPHREELLRLRQSGKSVETLSWGLRALGIEIAQETLRLWLNRELGRKPAKRRKPRRQVHASTLPAMSESAAMLASAASCAPSLPSSARQESATPASLLILPGETRMQAFRRRLAALDAVKQATGTPGASTMDSDSMPPS
ncbi:MAG: hypothetical protein PSV13_17075 [Lacunisphaera sp.]|nr:hypothetical protein [Lacunisphaera sp.]